MPTDSFSEKHIGHHDVQFDPKRAAVLVIDIVNEFFEPGGKMVLEGGKVLYEPVNALLDAAHAANVPVFWLNQTLRPEDTLFRKRIPHCIEGTWGAQIADAMHKSPDDTIIAKRRYSGFFQTDLDLSLRELKVETVIVTGCVTNICVRSTINDAFFLGYECIVPEECVSATSSEAQAVHLYDIDTHYGIVTNLDKVLPLLQAD